MKRACTAILAAVALSACGGGGDAASGAQASADYAGPIGSTDVEGGQAAYERICASCHSSHPLNDLGWSPARTRQQIREGSGRMPPIRVNRVSDEEMEAILAYMATIGAVVDEGAAPATSGGDDDGGDPDA